MEKGLFISIEGVEGAGKGLILSKIKEFFYEHKINFIATREPGGTKIAEDIRNIIVNEDIDAITEALLFVSARRHHVENLIKPSLKEGKLVITDRFIDSSLAYQGFGRGLGVEEILKINQFAIGDFLPDKTIYLDLEPSIGLKRISDNNRETNRLDKETIEFYNKNREGFLYLAKQYPNRYIVIDASKTPEEVFNEIYTKLLKDLI